MTNEYPQVMVIGGSDSDGSAGIEADLHSFFMRKAYGTVVMTAVVAGNSYGIHDSFTLPLPFISKQFEVLADDLDIKAVKTGMLADADLINTVADNLEKYSFGKLVVDPVIITKHGALLLESNAFETLKNRLIPLAEVITPNFYEAEHIVGRKLNSTEEIKAAAHELQSLGTKNVMIKGQRTGNSQKTVDDFVLLENGKEFWLPAQFFDTDRRNGTGDTLSAFIAAELAKGTNVEQSIRIAREFVTNAIQTEIKVGHKYGPINHWANKLPL
ncbi:phosphomethylpyrimidine kinase [Paucilactobacillus oligofermentans DSM 15707 = LMG 22743]|uniref:Hydroxymethylpyrimidine/phosphomethylpyrimidine kinase n=1 Tax=Paucilactobacillus oligofermentans DSM 15707 = LMG 22743 TaxID=1423778 RepID=A0A0R1RGX4_9LACO|nr:bifunctional hydroxymethylpyrimidine kinase/phosphomethylpyrimidine kinase [Paucilactobacillus oligofermentans]KRL55625.1 phosphomethylpyrimidine kinase [Paucilactobacillus oligofermentans DSM 15707 = LMG 22743]CUS25386.1 Phosphomethylpyrimidine kinase [Paucilactobacillus oligofermentans DSM 15707 = LMG 22743]